MSNNLNWRNSIKQNFSKYLQAYLQFYLMENDNENNKFNSADCEHT